jgi:hypothetical protein
MVFLGMDDILVLEKNKELMGGLVDFGGRGKYSFPEFTWAASINLFPSEKLCTKYENVCSCRTYMKGVYTTSN